MKWIQHICAPLNIYTIISFILRPRFIADNERRINLSTENAAIKMWIFYTSPLRIETFLTHKNRHQEVLPFAFTFFDPIDKEESLLRKRIRICWNSSYVKLWLCKWPIRRFHTKTDLKVFNFLKIEYLKIKMNKWSISHLFLFDKLSK